MGGTPLVNVLISTMCFLEGIALIWFPYLLCSTMLANPHAIPNQFDDLHLMLFGAHAAMKFIASAAFCTLDGGTKQTKALVMGGLIHNLICMYMHYKITPWSDYGLYTLGLYSALLGLSYISAEGTIGPSCLKPQNATRKKKNR